MSVISFEHLPVVTMTALIHFEGIVDISKIFGLLKITKLINNGGYKPGKKNKLPFCTIPGSIISASYGGKTRGIFKGKVGGPWRNSIMFDISSSIKNISIKLSKKSIHMCGSISEQLCIETVEHVISHIKSIEKNIKYINENKEIAQKTVEWIKENTIGPMHDVDLIKNKILYIENDENKKVIDGILYNVDGGIYISESSDLYYMKSGDYIDEKRNIKDENGSIYKYVKIKNHGMKTYILTFIQLKDILSKSNQHLDCESLEKYAKNVYNASESIHAISPVKKNTLVIPNEYYNKLPDYIDKQIFDFLIASIEDYRYHEEYCKYIEEVINYKSVLLSDDDLKFDKIYTLMVNYSYSINMGINRALLARCVDELSRTDGFEFKAYYNNTTDYCVTIHMPYKVPNDMKLIKNKRNNKVHTFMVYESGIVTQSGPNIEMMKSAYIKFNNMIRMIANRISLKQLQYKLKYKKRKPKDCYINEDKLRQVYYFEDPKIIEDYDENNYDVVPTVMESFNIKAIENDDLYDYLDILDIYWELVGNSNGSQDKFDELYDELPIDERYRIYLINGYHEKVFKEKINSFFTNHKDILSIVRCIISLGYIEAGIIYRDASQVNNYELKPTKFLKSIKIPKELEDKEYIEEEINSYWNKYMSNN